jgi:hypothetical protein
MGVGELSVRCFQVGPGRAIKACELRPDDPRLADILALAES